MNLTIEDRHKIQPFIDWVVDNKGLSYSLLFVHMEEYLNSLQKGREIVAEINSDFGNVSSTPCPVCFDSKRVIINEQFDFDCPNCRLAPKQTE